MSAWLCKGCWKIQQCYLRHRRIFYRSHSLTRNNVSFIPTKPQAVSIDNLDRRILERLQQDAGITNQFLADEVGLSASACLKRVQRLRERGIIQKVVALLDPEMLGPCLQIVVEVTMVRDAAGIYQSFEQKLQNESVVKQCYRVTGECDFVLIVIVRDMKEYDQFCDEVLYSDENLLKFRTLVARKRTKFDVSTVLPNTI